MRTQAAPLGATWFTILSDFQVQVISDLHLSLRDDNAEDTIYRTQFCLTRLGVTPMVESRMLKKLISMSRCSDLAFLFFMLESCYKGPQYAYSQRIIKGGIMYLDLEMTMRELDKILPPGVEILRVSKPAPEPQSGRSTVVSRVVSSGKKSKKSPYFMPLPKPTASAENKNKYLTKPARLVVTFPFWPEGEKPNYRVNEATRWFATFFFSPMRRMLIETVTDLMNQYFDNLGGLEKPDTMCEYHQEQLRQAQLVKDEALVKARDRCLALMDLESRHNALRQKEIIKMLNNDIEECTRRWNRLHNRQLTDVMLLEDYDQMCSLDKKVPTAAKSRKTKILSQEADIGKLSTAPMMGVHTIKDKGVVSLLSKVKVSEPDDDIPCPLPMPTESRLAKCPPQRLGDKKRTKQVVMKQTNMGETLSCREPSKSGRFFECPGSNRPFVFHYHEIAPKEEEPTTDHVICGEIVRTLRNPEEASSCSSDVIYNSRLNPQQQVVAAIVDCVESMWTESLKAYQKNNPNLGPQGDFCEKTKKKVFDWTKNIKHFDPDNKAQMARLLKDAFAVLKKDPRCVFASLPNAHKSFVMTEWIKRRYGKTYSHDEVGSMVNEGLPLFTRVCGHMNSPPSPDCKEFDASDTFDQVVSLTKRANKVKKEFRTKFNDKMLSYFRVCWRGMVPHLAKDTSLLNTFFAYLPVRYTDMLH
ncbi:hypothetical protein KR018_011262 [Drosophila ironensis]|nr:hypothetical protein KR018_011262 [Drosophila ironensis]